MASDFVLSGVLALQDAMSGTLRRAGAALKGFVQGTRGGNSGIRSMQQSMVSFDRRGQASLNVLRSLRNGVVAVGSAFAVQKIGGFALNTAADIEQLRVSFNTLLGSTELGGKKLEEIADFAAKTPFELPGLAESSIGLLNAGFAADQLIPTLTAVGDAASGLGKGQEGMQRIILALGQIRRRGKVSQEELNQLAEVGVNANAILQRELGLSADQVSNIADAGIDAGAAVDALVRGMGKDFAGMMAAQSRTFRGLTSTVMDNVKRVAAGITGIRSSGDIIPESAFESAKRVVDALGRGFDRLLQSDGLDKAAQAVGRFVDGGLDVLVRGGDRALRFVQGAWPIVVGAFNAINAVIGFATRHWPMLEPVLFGIAGAIAALKIAKAVTSGIMVLQKAMMLLTATNPILLAIGAVVGLIGFAVFKFIQASGGFQNAWEKIKLFFKAGVAFIKMMIADLLGASGIGLLVRALALLPGAAGEPFRALDGMLKDFRSNATAEFQAAGRDLAALNQKIAADKKRTDEAGPLASLFAPQPQPTPAESPITRVAGAAAGTGSAAPARNFAATVNVNVTPAPGQQLDPNEIARAARIGLLQATAKMGAGA